MTLIPSEGDSKGIAVCIVSVVFWTLAVMAVCLRLWARRIQKTALSLNDYAVFVALVSLFADSGCHLTDIILVHNYWLSRRFDAWYASCRLDASRQI